MVQKLSDTHPDAGRIQVELLRGATVARRAALTRSLTASAISLSRRAIARANPGLDEREVALLFVEYHYGKDLADRVRAFLAGRP